MELLSPEKVRFYRGTTEEAAFLMQLSQEWTDGEFWPFPELMHSLKVPGTFAVYLPGPDRWLGLAFGRVVDKSAELFYLHTSATLRRRGLGRCLLEAFCHAASECFHAEEVFLEVRPSNTSALRLYASSGFVLEGRRKQYYLNGDDALIFKRRIDKA